MSSQFLVKTKQIPDKIENISSTAETIRRLAEEIVAYRKELAVSGSSAEKLKEVLGTLHEQVLNEVVRMETFGGALEQILQLYTECEERIAEENTCFEEIAEERTGTDKRGMFSKFWDWLWKKKRDKEYTATTSEQERAADEAYKNQIEHLMDSGRYSEERWAAASVEERKQMLEEYMNEVADILGVDVKETINFIYQPPGSNGTLQGSYNDGSNRISINTYVLEKSGLSSYHLFTTVVHEMRHAYQHAAIKNPTKYKVSKETINSWKESFRTYQKEYNKGYDSYRKIVVEQDARAFAGQS